MPSKAKAAKGTLVQRADNAGVVFTTIGEVTSFNGPDGTTPEIPVESFDSTAMEVIAGLPDSGSVAFDMNFVGSDAQQQGLEADRVAGTLRKFKIVLNDHATTKTTFTFDAIVTAFSVSGGGVNEKYNASCTLRISGAVTKAYSP